MATEVGLLGIGCDLQSSFLKGPAKAPKVIRKALFSNSSNAFSELGCSVLDHKSFTDLGDLEPCINEVEYLAITQQITKIINQDIVPLVMGGDHAITYPVVKALSQKHPSFSILHFDAHPDLYDQLDGNRYSHACPFARIMELGCVNRLVQVGIRTMNDHQREQARKFGVESIEMSDFDSRNFCLDFIGPLYISFDMDALDPAYAPGVSHHEPGGLSSRDSLRILQKLRDRPISIIGADVVEYNPDRDVNGMTAMVAAKLLKELAGLMLTQSNG